MSLTQAATTSRSSTRPGSSSGSSAARAAATSSSIGSESRTSIRQPACSGCPTSRTGGSRWSAPMGHSSPPTAMGRTGNPTLSEVNGVALDAAGRMFVVDTDNFVWVLDSGGKAHHQAGADDPRPWIGRTGLHRAHSGRQALPPRRSNRFEPSHRHAAPASALATALILGRPGPAGDLSARRRIPRSA